MPVDYAEPTKLQDFKVEVFQPGSDTPTLTKQANNSTYDTAPGQLTVPNRDTSLGKPNNLPERQNSLRNDGQYRTIDVTPTNTAKPAPKKQNNQLITDDAGNAATYEAAYYAGLFIGGVISGALNNTPQSDSIKDAITLEELATTEGGYETGQELRRTVKEAVKNSEKLLDDLWRNKPTFEIPQTKIPKFDLPELPDLEPPKFPEFKFPEISFPKPQPVKENKPKPITKPKPPPTSLKHQFYIGEFDCYVSVTFGFYESQNQGGFNADLRYGTGIFSYKFNNSIPRPSYVYEGYTFADTPYMKNRFSNEREISIYRIYGGLLTKEGYGTGIAGTVWCSQFSFTPEYLKSNKGYVSVDLPDFYTGSSIGAGVISPPWDVLSVNFFDCKTTKPPELSPPPPPPEDDCCRMGCCPKPTEIDYRLIKKIVDQTLKEQKFAIEVPICKCELNSKTKKWTPKTDVVNMEVFATSQLQAYQLAQLHLENARQAADLCLARNAEEPIAAIPQSWQIRHEGGKPQLVIHCAEKKEDGNYDSAKYPITVPHWKGKVTDKPSLPPYKKGNWEGILVLADNTKVTINAANEAECTKILNAIKPWINSEMLKGSYFKGGKINVNIKQTQVKAMYGRYFSLGQKNGKPDWRVDFP